MKQDAHVLSIIFGGSQDPLRGVTVAAAVRPTVIPVVEKLKPVFNPIALGRVKDFRSTPGVETVIITPGQFSISVIGRNGERTVPGAVTGKEIPMGKKDMYSVFPLLKGGVPGNRRHVVIVTSPEGKNNQGLNSGHKVIGFTAAQVADIIVQIGFDGAGEVVKIMIRV